MIERANRPDQRKGGRLGNFVDVTDIKFTEAVADLPHHVHRNVGRLMHEK